MKIYAKLEREEIDQAIRDYLIKHYAYGVGEDSIPYPTEIGTDTIVPCCWEIFVNDKDPK